MFENIRQLFHVEGEQHVYVNVQEIVSISPTRYWSDDGEGPIECTAIGLHGARDSVFVRGTPEEIYKELFRRP